MIEYNKPKISWQETYAPELAQAGQLIVADSKNRTGSFLDRNPMLGKMHRCPLCGQRRLNGVRAGVIKLMTCKGLVELDYSLPCCNGKIMPVEAPGDQDPPMILSARWKWNQEEKRFEFIPREKSALPRHLVARKRMKPRLSRNRPPLFEMHDLIKQWEDDETLSAAGEIQDRIEGLPGHWTPQRQLKMQDLASFAEKVITRKYKSRAKKARDQQKQSRRINRAA